MCIKGNGKSDKNEASEILKEIGKVPVQRKFFFVWKLIPRILLRLNG